MKSLTDWIKGRIRKWLGIEGLSSVVNTNLREINGNVKDLREGLLVDKADTTDLEKELQARCLDLQNKLDSLSKRVSANAKLTRHCSDWIEATVAHAKTALETKTKP